MVLKRIVRPVLLSKSEAAFFAFEETPERTWLPTEEDSSFKNFRLTLLPIIGKLWTLGKLRGFAEDGIIPEPAVKALLGELDETKTEVAAFSAAIAIDGARLLRGSGLLLTGTVSEEESDGSESEEPTQDSGFLFDDMHEVDSLVKSVLVQAWPACACDAMFSLVDVLQADDTDEFVQAACSLWLDKLTPLVYSGLRDSFLVIGCSSGDRAKQVDFAKGLSTEDVLASCLRGLCALLEGASYKKDLVDSSGSELTFVIKNVSTLLLVPALGLNASSDDEETEEEQQQQQQTVASISPELVMEACKFIEVLADSEALTDGAETAFLLVVLTPLDAYQKKEVTFASDIAVDIVSSCLKALQKFIKRGKAKDALAHAMLQLSIDILSSDAPERVLEAARTLFTECLDSSAISTSLNREIAIEVARDGKWEAWALTCSHTSDIKSLFGSLPGVKEAMVDVHSVERHLAALSAVRSVVSNVTIPSEEIDTIMNGVGAQVLGLLQAHGTLSISGKQVQDNRLTACADCMKVIMTAYQNLVAKSTDDESLASFLSVVFEVWTSVIAYNGLPNQASPQPGADPTLGKLSAQAIVHVARSSPVAFKTSMTALSDQGRALLEFAVRADMSGYATTPTAQAPVKKKLSLQGFVK